MKKNILFITIFTSLVIAVFAQTEIDFEYRVNEGNITITGYKGNARNIIIPERINGLPVTAIGDEAFAGHNDVRTSMYISNLNSVIIPDTVKIIGKKAFRNRWIENITIGNSVEIMSLS